MLITTHTHTPVAANLPALNLRLVQETEDPKEKLEIAESSVEALSEVPKYEEVATFTQEALTGITGTARRQSMLSAALAAMAACPNMICVGHALIGNAPRAAQEKVAAKVLTRVETTSDAPELKIARTLLDDPELTSSEKGGIVQSVIESAGRYEGLLEATTGIINAPYEQAEHRSHAAQVTLDAVLPLVPAYSRELLELALDQLHSSSSSKSAIGVTKELLYAANEEPGRQLTSALLAAAQKAKGASKGALLQQSFELLRNWSTVEGMSAALDLVSSAVSASDHYQVRVEQASLQALAEVSFREMPVMAVAKRVVELARYAEPQGGIAETEACEPVLVAVLEGLQSQVADPEALRQAVERLKAVEPSTELPLGRSAKQAAIAARALQNAELL